MEWNELKQTLINSKYYYFHTDNGVLLCGDCLEVMKLIPKESIDLVVTSPPYDNLRYYSAKDERELENIWNFEKFKFLAKELYRITTKGGVVVWIVGDATIKGSESGNSFRQALYFKDECGFNLLDTMIYNKNNYSPCGSRYCYTQSFEYMFILTKGNPRRFNPLKTKNNNYRGRVKKVRVSRRKANGELSKFKLVKEKEHIKKNNVWTYSNFNRTAHPAPFPEQLAHDHIISWSNEGDIVLDPLCGSGTTAIACEKLNRRWIGIEINPEYCEIAKQRIQDYLNDKGA